MHILKRLLLVFATACILMFFSEFFFVNEDPAFHLVEGLQTEPLLATFGLLEFALWYSIPAYIFLIAVGYFSVNTIWGLILAGSFYGFTLEGVLVWQMYEALPFSISWTPIGWHVLVDVLLGWYLVSSILSRNAYWQTAALAIGLGLFWGFWATWYWVERQAMIPTEFALLAFTVGSLWIVAQLVLNRLLPIRFTTTKFEMWGVGLLTLFIFLVQIAFVLPIGLLVLPPLVAITFLGLHCSKRNEQDQSVLSGLQGGATIPNQLLLILTPLIAAATYSVYYHLNPPSIITELLPFFLMMAGFVVYGMALWKTIVHRRSKLSVEQRVLLK
ncbi:MAG: hypothetical protein GFH27_549321n38 [Chloroflexi bacterium AL-W]|nr:hypothetical protein [Chloroflexi bacterium AL-N1]NOK64916.1 hypothetical protein [Chloroflexi bacterium AL-N10]NOK76686.1 hypothetical protein [Chloroflexi bacterium AL-N5]NOK84577.1 hypothetical protein [Chloroflexi bacterium AL-W]NOK86598.1 hypothetical protein [Chloroflexi bacterium AL-N15]